MNNTRKFELPQKDELNNVVHEYLNSDEVNTVFILSDEVYNLFKQDSAFREKLLFADTLLASNTLMARDFIRSNDGKMVEIPGQEVDFSPYEYNSFEQVMSVVEECKATVFILTQNEKELEKCKMMLKLISPEINSWDRCCEDIKSNSDNLLNDINGIVPDVLMCSFDSPFEEEWILDNKERMNVKMVFGIGPGVSRAMKNKVTFIDYIKKKFRKIFGIKK